MKSRIAYRASFLRIIEQPPGFLNRLTTTAIKNNLSVRLKVILHSVRSICEKACPHSSCLEQSHVAGDISGIVDMDIEGNQRLSEKTIHRKTVHGSKIGTPQPVDIHRLPPMKMPKAPPLSSLSPFPLQNTARGAHRKWKAFGKLPNQTETPHMQIRTHDETSRKSQRIDSFEGSYPLRNVRVKTVWQNLGPQTCTPVEIPHKRKIRQYEMTIREPCSIAPSNTIPCNNKSRTAVPQNLGLEISVEIFLIVKY